MAQKGAAENFFFHFCKKNFFPKIDNIFMEKKKWKKKEIAAAPLASIIATRWTGNRIFVMGSLNKPDVYSHQSGKSIITAQSIELSNIIKLACSRDRDKGKRPETL